METEQQWLILPSEVEHEFRRPEAVRQSKAASGPINCPSVEIINCEILVMCKGLEPCNLVKG
jgi:hypothetical protein